MRIVSYVYLLCGVAACIVLFRDLRTNPDAFLTVDRSFAWVLSLPWSLIGPWVPDRDAMVTLLLFIVGIVVNFAMLRWVSDHAR